LEVEAGDNRGIQQVKFLRWDALNEQYVTLGILALPPFQLAVSAVDLNPAWNQVFVVASDLAGNTSNSPFIWLYKLLEGNVEYKVYLPVAGN
jgi:hypothetical protein